ncbi:uncharacterized protein CTRU02_209486 [Colletotrichum truncatum]|uniref:Uncharacterized protein n=1 Tax=Colletotrichum truncatum TaxID=5467 RepID=A0ACC3YSI2_COLTU
MAVGKLLRGKMGRNHTLPGADLYLEALEKLPDIMSLRRKGVIAIEILGMMAFYLQCADLRDDAYVHAGMALRIAMANGMADESSYQAFIRSEQNHRRRLWWTIYMQERRLAAATGQPLTIQDAHITTKLPTESPGFVAPAAMRINIKLANITGKIMDAIYGSQNKVVHHYVGIVKGILNQLLDVANCIPKEYSLNLAKESPISRTAGTLYLMLYQCVVLATRPTLLHLARNRLDTRPSEREGLVSTSELEHIANACIEAASRSIDVLEALKEQHLIANFGFFDLDAAYSAAFVFVLVDSVAINTTQPCGVSKIRTAFNIVKHLSVQGNKAAAKRSAEIEQTCNHLGISFHEEPEENVQGPRSVLSGLEDIAQLSRGNGDSGTERTQEGDMHQGEPALPDSNLSTTHFDWTQAAATLFDCSASGSRGAQQSMAAALSFAEGGNEMFNSVWLDDFSLTGVVETDWAELDKQLTSQSRV